MADLIKALGFPIMGNYNEWNSDVEDPDRPSVVSELPSVTTEPLPMPEFDMELRESYTARAPAFVQKKGRFDPFEMDKLEESLSTASYSTLIKRPILAFEDALQHAIQLVFYWAQEDEAESEIGKLPEQPVPKRSNADEQVEELRIAWRTAIRERKAALADWDSYVTGKRIAYQNAKRSAKR